MSFTPTGSLNSARHSARDGSFSKSAMRMPFGISTYFEASSGNAATNDDLTRSETQMILPARAVSSG